MGWSRGGWAVVVLSLASWGSACGRGDPCANITCSGHGQCVATSATGARCACFTGYAANGLSCVATSSGTACAGVGASCASNGDCCNYLSGTGYCVSGRCADSCSVSSECNSGCCATLVSGRKACSSPSNCGTSCRSVSSTCAVNGDCCNFLAGSGYCVDGFCADSCSRNSECISGCCAPLVGGGATCSAPRYCP